MRRRIIGVAVLLLLAGVPAPGAWAEPGRQASKPAQTIVPKTAPEEMKERLGPRTPEAMPFYVYNNAIFPPVKNFSPSGYMGDIADLKLAGSYKNLHQEGYPCLKVTYMAEGHMGWAGVAWQNPANNWGEFDGGYNLTQAKFLSFWARGDRGGETVEFKLGGTAANYPDSENLTTGPLTLTNEWTQYIVNLGSADLFYISSGFGLTLKQDENPNGCVFYVDDVRYQ
ncbi:MAG: hypothetical protein V1873_03725 [Verrucomicrobiota bacterium]